MAWVACVCGVCGSCGVCGFLGVVVCAFGVGIAERAACLACAECVDSMVGFECVVFFEFQIFFYIEIKIKQKLYDDSKTILQLQKCYADAWLCVLVFFLFFFRL